MNHIFSEYVCKQNYGMRCDENPRIIHEKLLHIESLFGMDYGQVPEIIYLFIRKKRLKL